MSRIQKSGGNMSRLHIFVTACGIALLTCGFCTQTVVLARCRTAEEAQQLISMLNSGLQRMVDDWLAQNDGPIPGDVWERIQREWRQHFG